MVETEGDNESLRLVFGEIQDGNVTIKTPERLEQFREGDPLIIMHLEDYVWILDYIKDLKKE
jgi:hypothetical protein